MGRDQETARLEELLASVRAGGSASLLIIGDAGMGKSALLDWLARTATRCRIVRAAGVEVEFDLPYAGLHQLCLPMLGSVDQLPRPQGDALRMAFGLTTGEISDRYLVGLAVLGLMSEVAATQPLLCIVDDAQWLDRPSIQALAFVSRRLGADSVGLFIASRTGVEELHGMPELELGGLTPAAARTLLDSVVVVRMDTAVREQFLVETHGNPLALLELPHTLTPAEAASGLVHGRSGSLSRRIETSFQARLARLPAASRQVLVLAAVEPTGDPHLLARAAERQGLQVEAADAAVEAGLLEMGERWAFRHPLVRSAVHRSATEQDRRRAHAALADATDADTDADRRAWHRAQATTTPAEDVAAALELTAERAKARGGLAVAGAFLERAALLTPDPAMRVGRALAATEALVEAGALGPVDGLLSLLGASELTEFQATRAERVRAQAAFIRNADPESAVVRQLLDVAVRLERIDPVLGRAAHIQALRWGFTRGPRVVANLAAALRSRARAAQQSPIESMLQGWADLLAHGFPAGADVLRDAMIMIRDAREPDGTDLLAVETAQVIARTLWDFGSWEVIGRRLVALAREVGALPRLRDGLCTWAQWCVVAGDFRRAEALFAEADAVTAAVGRAGDDDRAVLDALCCERDVAVRRIDAHQGANPRFAALYDAFRATVFNGAGLYDRGLEHAQRSCDRHPLRMLGPGLVELVESAVRCGHPDRARAAFDQLVVRTQLGGTDWALGLEARCRALVAGTDPAAEPHYREAIQRLERVGTAPDLARAHLVYGEWLRREGSQTDAREQLRAAYELFDTIGMPVFGERARRELAVAGETVRRRADVAALNLTAQEAQIARLAAEGLTNAEVATQLYLSPRTVEWHLRKAFQKLGITSRRDLRAALVAI